MSIRTAAQAAEVAANTHTNVEGTCQRVTRGYYLAPSAGDQDGDGDADAWDGWLSEPAWARVPGDRRPPLGYPLSFRSNDPRKHGHRAISFGGGLGRSTDFDGVTKRYRAGVVGTGTIAEIERAMNVTYVGWSKTIDGQPIPNDPPPPVTEKPQEDPVLTKVRTIVARIKANLYNPTRHLVDLDDLEQLIKLGHQPEAKAAKAFRDQIKSGASAFGTTVEW